MPLDFLSVLVVRGGAVCPPTPPSWFSSLVMSCSFILLCFLVCCDCLSLLGLKGRFIFALLLSIFLKDFIYSERGREGEKHQCVVATCTLPTGDLAHNPGVCSDWELNPRPFDSQADTQSTEPHQPELSYYFLYLCLLFYTVSTHYISRTHNAKTDVFIMSEISPNLSLVLFF